jgi:DNA-binding NarL/FixJ family response regulator
MGQQDRRAPGAQIASALIIEDHPLFSDALAMTLRSLLSLGAVETEDSLAAALARLAGTPAPDIILLDLNLPDVEGLDGLVRLKQAVGATPIVIVSSISNERTISAALGAGAAGYVPKHSQRHVFAAAFEAIARGEVFLPEGFVAERSGGEACDDALRRLGSLTPQQARILSLICDGKLNKQIAWELSISETTVKAHVTAIMRKLRVQSRTQAVLVAQEARFDTLSHG